MRRLLFSLLLLPTALLAQNGSVVTVVTPVTAITTTGTSGPATLSNGTLNIPQYSGGSYTALTQAGTTTQVLAAANSTSGDAVQFVLGSTSSASSNSTNLTIQSGNGGQSADLFDVDNAFGGAVVRVTPGGQELQILTSSFFFGSLEYSALSTISDCSSAASPAVCSAAPTGAAVVAATATTVVVDTSAVTATSEIFLTFDSSLGSKLGVTCNTIFSQPYVTARASGTSFTVAVGTAPTVNPLCFSYSIVN